MPKHSVFVGNLTWRVRSRHLRELFASTPGVQSVEVVFHTTSPRRSAGYGFVSFSSKEAAEAAISTFNGTVSILKCSLEIKYSTSFGLCTAQILIHDCVLMLFLTYEIYHRNWWEDPLTWCSKMTMPKRINLLHQRKRIWRQNHLSRLLAKHQLSWEHTENLNDWGLLNWHFPSNYSNSVLNLIFFLSTFSAIITKEKGIFRKK